MGRVEDRRDLGAFIPADLDDYPLTAAEFRVYCRVVRRCGNDGCYESVRAQAEAVGLGERTVREARALLLGAGLLRREHRRGVRDRLWLTPASEWAEPSELDSIRADSRRNQTRRGAVPTTAVPTTDEGTPEKVLPRRGGSRRTPAPDSFQITDGLRAWASSNGVTVDLDAETQQFLDHHRAKGSAMKDWTAAWRTWMRNSVKFARSSGRPPTEQRYEGLIRNG